MRFFDRTTNGRLLIAGTVVFASILLVVAFVVNDRGALPGQLLPSVARISAAKIVTPSETAAPVPEKAAAREPVSASLQREYRDAPDLYAFAMQARRRPAEGGLFYAMRAWDYCATVQPQYDLDGVNPPGAEIASTGTVSARRIETMERYQPRCGGFRNDDNTIYRALADEAKERTDPLWDAMLDLRAANKAGDRDAYVAAFKAMIDLQDPLLVSANVFWFNSLNSVGHDASGGLWFDGYDYSAAHEEEVYRPALESAVCVPDVPCYADERITLQCAIGVFCATDPADLFFNGPGAGPWPPGHEDRVRALADRMRAAIDRGDGDAFRAPH